MSFLIHWSSLISGILGLIIGSFLNVVIVRLPREESLILPSSRCMECKTKLKWWDNIPLFSFILLRGQCRHCQLVIPLRYPVVEFLTALLFISVERLFGFSLTLVIRDFPFVSLLIAITFIDLEHRIIPDVLSLGGLGLGLATCWLSEEPGWLSCVIGAGVGFVVFYGTSWAYYSITGRVGLGGGDIKLLAMLGAFLGYEGIFSVLLISSVFGSVVGVGWGMVQSKLNPTPENQSLMRMSIPYGPFLVVGGLYHYLIGHLLWFPYMIPT